MLSAVFLKTNPPPFKSLTTRDSNNRFTNFQQILICSDQNTKNDPSSFFTMNVDVRTTSCNMGKNLFLSLLQGNHYRQPLDRSFRRFPTDYPFFFFFSQPSGRSDFLTINCCLHTRIIICCKFYKITKLN